MDSTVDHIAALEQSLLDASIRADRDRVADLLSDDFVEFGSSGRVWTKETTLPLLAAEGPDATTKPSVTDLRVRLLGADAALITYVVRRQTLGETEMATLRSSVWRREGEKWRMLFHQGTRTSDEIPGMAK
jgi:hypothetical protein